MGFFKGRQDLGHMRQVVSEYTFNFIDITARGVKIMVSYTRICYIDVVAKTGWNVLIVKHALTFFIYHSV